MLPLSLRSLLPWRSNYSLFAAGRLTPHLVPDRVSGMRRALAAAVGMLITVASPADAQTSTFTINAVSGSVAAGQTVTVTGSGCPPTGALPVPTSEVLQLRLTPPSGGNAFHPTIINGSAQIISQAALFPGEADLRVAPNADGTFTATFTMPANSPSGSYTVRGICLTVLEPGNDGPSGLSQQSFDASQVTASGAITVQASTTTTASATTSTSTTSTAPPPVVARPTFTG